MSLPSPSKSQRDRLIGPVAMVLTLGVFAVAFIYLGVLPWALGWAVRAALFLMGSR